MQRQASNVVEQVVRIDARPETIFPFFTDPVKLMRWKGTEATMDPRPGGAYRVNVTGRDIVRGEYVEVTPFTKIVFTWGWEDEGSPIPPGSSTVEVTLTPDCGGTILRLRHTGLPAAAADRHLQGWVHYTGRLKAALEGNGPGPDPWVSRPM